MPVVEVGIMIGVITQNELAKLPALMNSVAEHVCIELLSSGPLVEMYDNDQDGFQTILRFADRPRR